MLFSEPAAIGVLPVATGEHHPLQPWSGPGFNPVQLTTDFMMPDPPPTKLAAVATSAALLPSISIIDMSSPDPPTSPPKLQTPVPTSPDVMLPDPPLTKLAAVGPAAALLPSTSIIDVVGPDPPTSPPPTK